MASFRIISDDNKVVGVINDGTFERLAVHAITDQKKGKYISVKLDQDISGGGHEMNVDGSSTPINFIAQPPSGKKWYIARMMLTLEDMAISHTKFGGLTPLTNGVDIKVTESGVERPLAEHLIKTNSAFYQLAYDVVISSAITDILSMRWTFTKGGTFLELLNSTSDNFKVVINDNLTGLSSFQVLIQGYEVNE